MIKLGQIFKVEQNGVTWAFVTPACVENRVILFALPNFIRNRDWIKLKEEQFGVWSTDNFVPWVQARYPEDPMWNSITEEDFCKLIGKYWDRECFIPITLDEYKRDL